MGLPYAAGALYSTVDDLFLWDQALYTTKLLSRKSLDAMFTPFKDGYAYGWGIGKEGGRRFMAHTGGIQGFSTSITRFPDEKDTVIFLSNNDRASAGTIGRDLASILFGEKYEVPRERKQITLDPKMYDAYVGEYELKPGIILKVTKAGEKLMIQVTGQPSAELFPESESRFFLRVVDAEITFVVDAKGQVTSLILRQGGQDTPAKKIK